MATKELNPVTRIAEVCQVFVRRRGFFGVLLLPFAWLTPPHGRRWATAGVGSNIPGVGAGCDITVTVDGKEITNSCFHADERIGIADVHIPTSNGEPQVDPDIRDQSAKLRLHGRVLIFNRTSKSTQVECGRNTRQLIGTTVPHGKGLLLRLDHLARLRVRHHGNKRQKAETSRA